MFLAPPLLEIVCFTTLLSPSYCRTTGAMGGLAYHITSTRLRIGLAQTLRRLHIAFVRLRAELTETSIAVNHSMNESVKH